MNWIYKRQLHVAVVTAFLILTCGRLAKGQQYSDPVQGVSSDELVRRALASNGELAAVRI